MLARVRSVDVANAPLNVRQFARQFFVNTGDVYTVCAIVVFRGVSLFQILDRSGWPAWKPSWFFDVEDPALASDWVCRSFSGDVSLLLGPEFIARDVVSYGRMVELESPEKDLFFDRFYRLNGLGGSGTYRNS